MIVITVARKPLSEANVAANVLKHGCGAINVNACRVATADDLNGGAYSAGGVERHDGTENWRYKRGEQGGLAGVGFAQPLGRWPANLILGHRDGCRLTGTRTVRSDGHYPNTRPKGSEVSGPSGHAGQEGLAERYTDGESVSVWECTEDCPVAGLDAQSGARRSAGLHPSASEGSGKGTVYMTPTRPQGTLYEDRGGASRYFKQVGGER